ncbi:MAG: sigma-70 family RNA polymerase sigma factor [bacterium]|nr:sigma-70 family RNA polymerase sigma factor [bacterium]
MIQKAYSDLLAGVPDSDDRLYRLLWPQLLRQATPFLAHTDIDPVDVVQDSLISLLAYFRNSSDLADCRVAAYASVVVRNRCRDVLRRKRAKLVVRFDKIAGTLKSSLKDPLEELVALENSEWLNEAILALPQSCRTILKELYYRGRTVRELAETMKLNSVQVLYYRRNQCLKKLKRNFKKSGASESIDILGAGTTAHLFKNREKE